METKIYNQQGKETGKIALPERVFGLPWNGDLVHQVVTALAANKRAGTAHTKDRSEVSGGGKKPWKQKGTGRARHGSTRSPIWVGGGIAHGPRSNKNYAVKINRKMMAKALYTALSQKMRNGELLFIDSLALPEGKTKGAKEILNAFSGIKGYEKLVRKQNGLFVAGFGIDTETKRAFRNLGNALIGDVRTMTPADTLTYTCIAIVAPKESIAFLEGKMATKGAPEGEKKEKPAPKKSKRVAPAKSAKPAKKAVKKSAK